jgi:hypothetical protein
VAKYLVYPLNIVDTANLDVDLTIRELASQPSSLFYWCKVSMTDIKTKIVTPRLPKPPKLEFDRTRLKNNTKAKAEYQFAKFLEENALFLNFDWGDTRLQPTDITLEKLVSDARDAFIRKAAQSATRLVTKWFTERKTKKEE